MVNLNLEVLNIDEEFLDASKIGISLNFYLKITERKQEKKFDLTKNGTILNVSKIKKSKNKSII